MIAINAGIASVISLKSILVTDVNIKNPTTIKAGAVAKDGIARKIGDRNRDRPNKIAAVTSGKSGSSAFSIHRKHFLRMLLAVEVPSTLHLQLYQLHLHRRAPLILEEAFRLCPACLLWKHTPIKSSQSIKQIYKQETQTG